jgi:F-type H+-transporting ATPase subunit delta
VRQTILARRYAKALFSLGREQDKYEAYNQALSAIAALYEESPEIGDALVNPLYPLEARQKIMTKIAELAQADKMLAAFLSLLVEKHRAGILPDIAQDDLVAWRLGMLEKITGNRVILETEVDSSIIGGIIAKVGDLVLDGSIKTQLNGLKESIKGRD